MNNPCPNCNTENGSTEVCIGCGAPMSATMAKSAEAHIPWNQPLFELMAQEHGLTLLESEMNDIIHVVRNLPASINDAGLASCPFCGSDDIEKAPRRGFPVQCECRKCRAEGPANFTSEEAIEGWNKRN
ncbi:MAG: hypothetical protein JWM68_3759 [Verrucomicrobiales bacterium]|nr:hypothetical protein [Verrucomicrobiales bacterium]